MQTAMPTSKVKKVAAMLKAILAEEDRLEHDRTEQVLAKLKEMKPGEAAALPKANALDLKRLNTTRQIGCPDTTFPGPASCPELARHSDAALRRCHGSCPAGSCGAACPCGYRFAFIARCASANVRAAAARDDSRPVMSARSF